MFTSSTSVFIFLIRRRNHQVFVLLRAIYEDACLRLEFSDETYRFKISYVIEKKLPRRPFKRLNVNFISCIRLTYEGKVNLNEKLLENFI